MIGLLQGKVLLRQPPHVLLDVNGVGYELEIPLSAFDALPANGEPVVFYTHLMIRDDAHSLYGFLQESERRLFRDLLKVNGVGGKMALAILSCMEADEFVLHVQSGDVKALTRIPGVGKKTAERLLIEMRDRLQDFSFGTSEMKSRQGNSMRYQEQDAIQALLALGYSQVQAERMIKAVFQPDLKTEALIKLALRRSL